MTEIIFLGVGGAMAADPADNHTALVVRDGAATFLLDCGPTIMRQMELSAVSAGELTHVFVSHQHGDHALGFPMLLLNRVLFWPDLPLIVMGTPLVIDVLQRLAELAYPDLYQRIGETIDFVELDPEGGPSPVPGAGATQLLLAPGRHSVPSWGVRLSCASGTSLVYSSDTGPSASIAWLARGVDLLVHEAFYLEPPSGNRNGHSAAEEVGALATEAGVGTLALVHRSVTGSQAAGLYVAQAARLFGGRILVPNAGDRITL